MFNILHKIDTSFLTITIFILYMAGAATFTQNDTIYTVLFILFAIIFFTKVKTIDNFIIYILIIWIIINIISSFYNSITDNKIITFIGVTMKIILPYFMVKIVGRDFFNILIKYIYYLTLISLPFYIIDAIVPELFNSFSPFLNFITQEQQKMANGWYIFIYMHSAWAFLTKAHIVYRNSGFMWEPGGYALMLIFAFIYRLNTNNFKWDKYITVFTIAIITTFSTSGYIALTIILIFYLHTQWGKNFTLYIPLIIIVSVIYYQIYNLNFISGKIDYYIENIDYSYNDTFKNVERVNRIAAMRYSIEQASFYPLGNGVLPSNYIKEKYSVNYEGSNTLAHILNMWGWIGLIALLVFLYKFFNLFFSYSKILPFIMTISFSIVLFSNSIEVRPLLYTIIYYYFLENKLVSLN